MSPHGIDIGVWIGGIDRWDRFCRLWRAVALFSVGGGGDASGWKMRMY